MKFTVEHPLTQHECVPELYGPDGLAAFARAAEESGFDAIAFSEHPAPPRRWMEAGGHKSLDPLAALAFCAAATESIGLMSYMLVMPLRSPLSVAKSIATVDRLSAGRLIVGATAGYLRSEFAALGVDFDERGALLDDALEVLRTIWTGKSWTGHGRSFRADDQVSAPGPVQLPCPPLWIGGNGGVARRRVARFGDGWSPMLLGPEMARHSRTAPLTTADDLGAAVSALRELLIDGGREPSSVGVQVVSPRSDDPTTGGDSWHGQHRHHLAALAEAGATRFIVRVPAGGVAQACDALAAYGSDIIAEIGNREPQT